MGNAGGRPDPRPPAPGQSPSGTLCCSGIVPFSETRRPEDGWAQGWPVSPLLSEFQLFNPYLKVRSFCIDIPIPCSSRQVRRCGDPRPRSPRGTVCCCPGVTNYLGRMSISSSPQSPPFPTASRPAGFIHCLSPACPLQEALRGRPVSVSPSLSIPSPTCLAPGTASMATVTTPILRPVVGLQNVLPAP